MLWVDPHKTLNTNNSLLEEILLTTKQWMVWTTSQGQNQASTIDRKNSQDKVLLGRRIVNSTQTAKVSEDSKIINKILEANKTRCRHMTLEANRTKCHHRTSEANSTRCFLKTSVARCLSKILEINRIQWRDSQTNSINLMSMTRHKHLKYSKTCKTLSLTNSMTSKIS